MCLCWACKEAPDLGNDNPRLPEDTPTEIPGNANEKVIKVVSQSIAQDSVVRAENTSSLVITYSAEISINKPEYITINDRVIVSAMAQGNTLILPLSLEAVTDYVVIVREEALTAGANTKVKSFTLNFSTRATVNLKGVKKTLCNVNPATEAVNLYNEMLSTYGKQTLSGIRENISSNTAINQIFTFTSSYPAIACYDFSDIHVADYSNVENLVSHYESGGIISFGWGWLTPSQENDTPETYSVDSEFSIRKALIMTNWEYRWIESDIERIASCLRLLQERGVPVVFSPMVVAQNHWWGRDGAGYFKELWKLLYDRLVVAHKLNNLIWVWTTEVENMTEEQIMEWYPGDEYVDIVAIAPKVNESRSLIDDFLLLNEAFNGKNMLAIADCVAIPNPDKCYAEGDTWLYFIAPSHFSVNTPTYWNTLMSHPSILPRKTE